MNGSMFLQRSVFCRCFHYRDCCYSDWGGAAGTFDGAASFRASVELRLSVVRRKASGVAHCGNLKSAHT